MSLLPQRTLPVPEFQDMGQAAHWMYDKLDEDCTDNFRFAFIGDKPEIQKYNEQQNNGCCGFFDREVKVGGRLATIGCNYGH